MKYKVNDEVIIKTDGQVVRGYVIEAKKNLFGNRYTVAFKENTIGEHGEILYKKNKYETRWEDELITP